MRTVADIKVRQLNERVARALQTRAASRGVSLEEEVRAILTASVSAKRDAFRRRATALRAESASHRSKRTDSVRTIRQERDTTG